MKLTVSLEREVPWERHGPPIAPVPSAPHRPRKAFRVRLRSPGDAAEARRYGIPLLLVRSEDLKILHYPLRIPPTVIVPREYAGVLDTDYRIHVFESLKALRTPRLEDIAVFLLSFDLVAARAVLDRNRDLFDFDYLRKRIVQEDMEEAATKIHVRDFVDVPVVGRPLPRDALRRAAAANRVTGVVP